ncbi:unnamed protein product [Schistocephalus solidus]|uniref:Uncharacterized protein n=1 Tax=Schistocephalus solidus TaxID=70667 RepID=A0A183T7E5_SCHSO|nr:unnamed protein product [Schistocephalus solidus]
MQKDNRQKCSSFEEAESTTHGASLLSGSTKRRASSARIDRNDSSHPSSEELQWVREDIEWERCSTTPRVARSVRLKNCNERRRLQTLRLSLDRQLERELRRLEFERNEFVEALERASGRPRTAVLRSSGTSQIFESRESQSQLSSPSTAIPVGPRPVMTNGLSLNRLRVQITPNTLCASEGCSPSNPLPKPIWGVSRSDYLPVGEEDQAKDSRPAVASLGHPLSTVVPRPKNAKTRGRGDRRSHDKPRFFLSSGESSSSDMRRSAQLSNSSSLLRYHSAGALSKKLADF